MAFQIIADGDALLETTYGRIFLAKIGILLVPLGLAGWNRFWLVPAVERDPNENVAWHRLRGTVTVEALLLVIVIGLTGFLVLQSPSGSTASGEPGAATTFQERVELEAVTIAISISPGIVGENILTLELRDAGGQPFDMGRLPEDPANKVDAFLSLPAEDLGPLVAEARPAGQPGVYATTIAFPLEGEWEVELAVRTSRFEQSTVTITVPIRGQGG
jgi:copper transport protein